MFTRDLIKSKIKNYDKVCRFCESNVICETKDDFLDAICFRIQMIEPHSNFSRFANRIDIKIRFTDSDEVYFYGISTYRTDFLDIIEGIFSGIESKGFGVEIDNIDIHAINRRERQRLIFESINERNDLWKKTGQTK